jgi:hypothetical protein
MLFLAGMYEGCDMGKDYTNCSSIQMDREAVSIFAEEVLD